jgi:hypothetical protein
MSVRDFDLSFLILILGNFDFPASAQEIKSERGTKRKKKKGGRE